MDQKTVGFAFTGSFCTLDRALDTLRTAVERYAEVIPIVSERVASTDTRFGTASEFLAEVERLCGRPPIATVAAAEPIGPKKLLDVLIVCPCTGNTLAKLAAGVTDSAVTMAVKAHLRNARPVVLAVSSNDALAAGAKNVAALLDRKHCFFVPFRQDDPAGKPASLVAEFSLVCDAADAAARGEQLQPLLLGAKK